MGAQKRQKGSGLDFLIQYGEKIVNKQPMKAAEAADAPIIGKIPKGAFLIMYDPDAPRSVGTYLHWLQGVPATIATMRAPGEEIVYMPYTGPSPPPGTGVHRYIFKLVKGKPLSIPKLRADTDVDAIIGEQPVLYENYFKVASLTS